MTFTLKLDLAPGTTWAEIQRQVELVASKLPVDSSKPDGPEEIHFMWPGRDTTLPRDQWPEDVVGEWRIYR